MNTDILIERIAVNFTREDWKTVLSGALVLTISALGMIAF